MKRKLFLMSVIFTCITSYVQSQITATNAPSTTAIGSPFIAGFTYNATTAGTCQIQLFKTDSSGNINYSAGTDVLYNASVPAGTGLTVGPTFTVSNTVMTTSSLPAGQVYKWFFKLTFGGTDYYGANVQTTVTPLLANNEFDVVSSNDMFLNSRSKQLIINSSNVSFNNANIYDLMGRNVAVINNLKNAQTLDLSFLQNGVFVLITDDNKKLKFVL